MIKFYKYQGAGNDFIMIDNRERSFGGDKVRFAQKWCDRKFGIGSDGVIFVEKDDRLDFNMDFYNPDGSQSFCGNGSRCAIAFSKKLGIISKEASFKAVDGNHLAKIEGDLVHILMNDVLEISEVKEDHILNTGSPHYIKYCDSIENLDIVAIGRSIRYSPQYEKNGINVNFLEELEEMKIRLRTYERGVENETLACGTGATAAAISFAKKNQIDTGVVKVIVQGGELEVSFEKTNSVYSNIWLIGPVAEVFKGEINA